MGLVFATVRINQVSGRARGKADIGPVFEEVAALDSRPDDARGHKSIELPAAAGLRHCRRYELRDNAPVRCDRNAVASFDSPNVAA